MHGDCRNNETISSNPRLLGALNHILKELFYLSKDKLFQLRFPSPKTWLDLAKTTEIKPSEVQDFLQHYVNLTLETGNDTDSLQEELFSLFEKSLHETQLWLFADFNVFLKNKTGYSLKLHISNVSMYKLGLPTELRLQWIWKLASTILNADQPWKIPSV